MRLIKNWLYNTSFTLLLKLMDRTDRYRGAAEDGAATYVQWFGSSRVDRSIIVLQVSYRRFRFRTIMSPAQAHLAGEGVIALVRDQTGEGNEPQDWDTRGIRYNLVQE